VLLSVVPVRVPAAAVTVPVAPRAIVVPLTVTELYVKAPLGIDVNDAPLPLNTVADNVPVDGTKDSLVELVVAGLLPVDAADRTGYQVELELVLSVIATLFALVAVVAVVAVDALPVKAPTKVVDVTLVSPAIVVAVPPRLIAVEPTVIDELLRAELGMLVKDAPEPLKTVAVSVPVDGLN